MKKKELKNLAKRIARAEMTINADENPAEVREAKEEIMALTSRITNTDDMLVIDEMVQNILSENSF